MKKFVMSILILVFCFSTGLVVLSGCNDDEECEDVMECSSGGTLEACCTDDQCRYLLDGEEYPCNGTDCSAAAEEVASVCVGKKGPVDDVILDTILDVTTELSE